MPEIQISVGNLPVFKMSGNSEKNGTRKQLPKPVWSVHVVYMCVWIQLYTSRFDVQLMYIFISNIYTETLYSIVVHNEVSC